MDTTVGGAGVLDKAVTLLGALEPGPLPLAAVAATTGVPRATTHRLLVTLEGHGLVRRTGDGRYALGLRLVGLGRAAAAGLPVADAALPALGALRDATGESAQLYVRQGDRRVCVVSLESPHGLRTIVPVGASLPLDAGSAGRVLTAGGATSTRSSWVQSVGEREAGVASVSAPVRGADGGVLAAIGVSGPIERTTRSPGRRYGTAVADAARAVEAALRGTPG